ncbi:MAG: hypothetical protein AB8B65_19990 [Kordia sp.]|uniref:hypothetical protein n=1 Tax=Kordia sp. TaxID=1965332 RepID=UPI00385CAC39
MKKQSLKSLQLNKKSISSFFIKGGINEEGNGSEEAQATYFVVRMFTKVNNSKYRLYLRLIFGSNY